MGADLPKEKVHISPVEHHEHCSLNPTEPIEAFNSIGPRIQICIVGDKFSE